MRSRSKKESGVGKAELSSAPSCLGGEQTQSDPSKASSSGRVLRREGRMVLFSVVLPRQSFPPVHAAGGLWRC